MASITINEISQSYGYNIGTNSFATVALPITASWGPAFEDPTTLGQSLDTVLENTTWQKFTANSAGLQSFVATYRGPAANYRISKDFSYQMAMTLLTNGYDVLTCRLCPGSHAEATLTDSVNSGTFTLRAKYPGTFGNSIYATVKKVINKNYWNLIAYVVDASGIKTAVENLVFAFDIANSTDTVYHIDELESSYFEFIIGGTVDDTATFNSDNVTLTGGSDRAADGTASDMMDSAIALATTRYSEVSTSPASTDYVTALGTIKAANPDVSKASTIRYKEWLYTNALNVYTLLKDKLAYNHNRVISPGWDDQDITELTGDLVTRINVVSPIHSKLLEVAYYSRCATAYIDIPRSCPRSAVYNEDSNPAQIGYAQMLGQYTSAASENGSMYQSHSALFAPWGQYTYTGTAKMNTASPSLLALLIQHAMIINQSLQYEWIQPSSRSHNLNIGKMDYSVPKKLLDIWQTTTGVGVNVITAIPDLGTNVWGNSTLYPVPPATYQALANLSTRLLVNAVENAVYRVGTSITFQYNNNEAYSRFYAGVTPILDTMLNAGAIDKYKVEMSADISGLDQINANSVIGKVYLWVNGVINDITVDIICLPTGVDA